MKPRTKTVRLPEKKCVCGAELGGTSPAEYVDYILREWDKKHASCGQAKQPDLFKA